MEGLRYAVVTPARNEAAHLRRLAGSLTAQALKPVAWVIVDDGSTDETEALAEELEREHSWIRRVPAGTGDSERIAPGRGAPVVAAFHAGLAALAEKPELVAKVDADISMDEDYFERLVGAFREDGTLGIASGTCYEHDGREWRQRFVTGASVWGAARVYRWRCLDQVLPLEQRMGWDGIDIVKANVRGWSTRTFLDLPFRHHRVEAVRERSRWHAWALQGEASHYMGYRPSYVLARTLHQMRRDPAALAMLSSFLAAMARRSRTCPDPGVRRYVRSSQRLRTLPRRRREASGR
jgi:poly-beta-1,6-N-acetyl-D-glucosamine synthase